MSKSQKEKKDFKFKMAIKQQQPGALLISVRKVPFQPWYQEKASPSSFF